MYNKINNKKDNKMHQNSYNNVQQNQNNNLNINEFKKKPLGVLTIDNNGQGYESTFSYINNPRQAKRVA